MRRGAWALSLFAATYLLLLIPDPDVKPIDLAPATGGFTNFVWKQDSSWQALEREFASSRSIGAAASSNKLDPLFQEADTLLASIETEPMQSDSPALTRIEGLMFQLAPWVAARPSDANRYATLVHRLRTAVKEQSWRNRWDLSAFPTRVRLYRLLFGSRQALDEVLAQGIRVETRTNESSRLDGKGAQLALPDRSSLHLKSGDLLLSRGEAPASALIARGNDFRGNFSHAAVAHVDEQTGKLTFVESLIRHGLVVTSAGEYASNKLRILVLRLRPDHPVLRENARAPHQAAESVSRRALSEHVPYDFTLDFQDHSKLFCSEVASSGYSTVGVNLWMGMSHISSPGLKMWLHRFGVRHFESQEPSDLEYDPQLQVVAEWRGDLRKDRIDNAAMDAMLETADAGASLGYSQWKLPLARAAKAAGTAARMFSPHASLPGADIPDGMSATAALRQVRLNEIHNHAVEKLAIRAADFRGRQGYEPPSWQLLGMARECLGELR